MSNLALSRRLWRWISFSKMLPSLFLIVVSISRIKNLICASLCDARPSSAPINDEMRWWGSELLRKNGSSTRFEEMDTEIGTCLPIHNVVFVSFKDSSWLQIDSKSDIAKFVKKFSFTCVLDAEGNQLVKESLSNLIYVPLTDNVYSFTASG